MSRSYRKSNMNNYGGFDSIVIYRTNKSDKFWANKLFRAKSKHKLRMSMLNGDLETHTNIHKLQEVSDTWDFSSDGLKYFINYKKLRLRIMRFGGEDYYKECVRKIKRK